MIETDVLIVGAGPAGLAAAIALRRGAKNRGDGKSPVCWFWIRDAA